jgi:hypothetical protein
MLLFRLFIFSALFFNTLHDTTKDKLLFISPVRIPLQLSANFGELRIDHFHSGVDIKTQGVTGKEVIAPASGYIYRISVSPGGFGNALYIKHQSGYSTVYGHLSKFTPEVDNWVKSKQYERKSFLVTLFPEKDKFPVKQGEIIAFSGNSGSSGGPHLHYEIRKADSEMPLNPLLFEFGINDNIKPVIEMLIIYPVNRNSLVNNQHNIKKLYVEGENGKYRLSPENSLTISGLTGFGIKSYDQLNESINKCAVYSIELKIDSITRFRYVMDSFSFNESRYINSHIDYEIYTKENIYVERAFLLPNDKLSVYKDVTNRGLFNFNDNKLHNVEVLVTDIHKNKSSLTFKVKGKEEEAHSDSKHADSDFIVMPFERTNKFSMEDLSISIPSGALYDTLNFDHSSTSGRADMLSDLYSIHNKFTPLQKAYSLSIKPSIIPKGKESKMMIVELADDLKKNALPSIWEDEFLKAEPLTFGNFYIGIDTIPPVISANGLVPGTNMIGRKEIKIKITDDFSGIKSYTGLIDEKWALFEYDQKINTIVYRFDENRIGSGIKHNLSLKVVDNKDNISYFNCDFVW